MRTEARVVVIGGGIAGCSVLWHLTRLGWTDVVLVERDELTAGSTWHAAGNCPNFSTSWAVMRLQHCSNRLYGELTERHGIARHVTGSLRLAHTRDRMDEFAHVADMANAQGIAMRLLTPMAARELYPHLELHDLAGVLHDPLDGDIDPSQVTQALATEARAAGAEIRRFSPVTGIERAGDAWRVHTTSGVITARHVVNAAGYRAGEVGAMVGLDVPVVTMQHQYLVTEPIAALAGMTTKLPLLRDPDESYYLRQERDGLLLGPYEKQATPAWLDGIPPEFGRELYADDLERLEPIIELAMARVPLLAAAGIMRVVNGPIPYTPDGLPLLGPAAGLANFWQCCAFSFGIVQGGGAGRAVAEWIVHGEPVFDLWPADARRYTGYATKDYTVARAVELYANEYAIAFPQQEWPAGRPVRTTPLHDLLAAKGARFGARGGWERAMWFGDREAASRSSFRRPDWFDAVGEECRAVRERVGLFDIGGFTKLEVSGDGAADWLDGVLCGPLPAIGRVTLGYVLNAQGGIRAEFTVSRFAADRFYLCSAAAAEWHDRQVLEDHARPSTVTVADVSARYGTLVLAGPRARHVLAAVTASDVGNVAVPWLSVHDVAVGMAPVRLLRLTYTGELGFELHVPTAHLRAVYVALIAAGERHGIRDAGMYALDSLRLEKSYPAWKSELVTDMSPLAAGLGRFVALAKPSFPGRAVLVAERETGPAQRLVTLAVESGDADALAAATVWQGEERVGIVTSAGYGHVVGQSIALAYVRADLASPGTFLAVTVLGTKRPGTVTAGALWDPGNERPRG